MGCLSSKEERGPPEAQQAPPDQVPKKGSSRRVLHPIDDRATLTATASGIAGAGWSAAGAGLSAGFKKNAKEKQKRKIRSTLLFAASTGSRLPPPEEMQNVAVSDDGVAPKGKR